MGPFIDILKKGAANQTIRKFHPYINPQIISVYPFTHPSGWPFTLPPISVPGLPPPNPHPEAESALKNFRQTDILIMDFVKAFDKVDHSLLIHKLHHYDIRGEVNKWIKNWLKVSQYTRYKIQESLFYVGYI